MVGLLSLTIGSRCRKVSSGRSATMARSEWPARPERSQETDPDFSNWESSEMARTIRKLTAIDASYLYMETPEVPMHIGSMAIFQLPNNHREDFFEGLKAMIGRRLHLAPMLTWKLAHTPL